jgi:hypothetical protein
MRKLFLFAALLLACDSPTQPTQRLQKPTYDIEGAWRLERFHFADQYGSVDESQLTPDSHVGLTIADGRFTVDVAIAWTEGGTTYSIFDGPASVSGAVEVIDHYDETVVCLKPDGELPRVHKIVFGSCWRTADGRALRFDFSQQLRFGLVR